MNNQEIKNGRKKILSLWFLIAAVSAGGTFLLCLRIAKDAAGNAAATQSTSTDDIAAAIATPADSGPMQTFSGAGFSFSVPASWYVEKNGDDAVAAYPDYSPAENSSTATPTAPGAPMCKIEISSFPYSSDTSMSDWISERLGADPSVAVAENSAENISLTGGGGVRWTGAIDGAPTTLVYAFSASHAFEIAPSVINETSADAGNAQCADALQTFLSQLILE